MRSGPDDRARPRPTPWRVAWVVGPVFLALFAVGGTFGAAHQQPAARSLDALAIVLVLAGALALTLVWRAPREVLALVTGATALYIGLGYPYGPVFIAFAIAIVVVTVLGHRVWVWAALAVTLAVTNLLHVGAFGPRATAAWSWEWALGTLAWALVLVGIGELLRARRARVVEARRARAELERRQAGEERLQIARELHDVVAHHMSLINVQASVALELREQDPDHVEAALQTIKGASKEALTELRSLIGVLRADGHEAPRAPVANLTSLDELAERARRTGLSVDVEATGALEDVPSAVSAAAVRILQEAVTNVVRHSGATAVRIAVDVSHDDGDDAVELLVEDDGRGVGADPTAGDGTGIRGMHERSRALGGWVEVRPRPGRGTRVRARLPIGRST